MGLKERSMKNNRLEKKGNNNEVGNNLKNTVTIKTVNKNVDGLIIVHY